MTGRAGRTHFAAMCLIIAVLQCPDRFNAGPRRFPLETELLAAARRNGQTVTNGVSMVIVQAAEAFRLITGIEPDNNRMPITLLDAIAAERAQEKAA
jgi:hypothetical protein